MKKAKDTIEITQAEKDRLLASTVIHLAIIADAIVLGKSAVKLETFMQMLAHDVKIAKLILGIQEPMITADKSNLVLPKKQ